MSSGESSRLRRTGAAAARQTELPLARPEGAGRRVAITGNRGITNGDREAIRARMRELCADAGVAAIFFGGATGADTAALAAALELRREGDFAQRAQGGGGAGTDHQRQEGESRRGSRRGVGAPKELRPRLIVVLPDTVEAQPKETWETSRRADEIVELGHPIRVEDRWRAYHLRNRRLVAEATELVAFWNGDPKSGTASTIRLARKRGMAVAIVEVEGGDREVSG
ncbi:MAG: hypothetical protein HY907_04670 [Deltaproteobacteria bacterium]|nr:hypothetical protein [Deltaproteobacteria bacterium]